MKKLATQSTVLLKHHLKTLKLPTVTAECERVAARGAKENVDHLVIPPAVRAGDRGPRAAGSRPAAEGGGSTPKTRTSSISRPHPRSIRRWCSS